MKTKMTKYQGGGAKKKSGTKSKKSLTPNSFNFTGDVKQTDKGIVLNDVTKITNNKGKLDRIISETSIHDGRKSTKKKKEYDATKVPTYRVSSSGNTYGEKESDNRYGRDYSHFKKQLDTTGYAAGKQNFTEITKKRLPGSGEMFEIIKRPISRKAVKPVLDKMKKAASKMKTGGMVNPNAKLQAAKTASTKGVMSGVNPKAAASKVAKGRSGGTSAASKTAVPKAKYGMSMTKMKKK